MKIIKQTLLAAVVSVAAVGTAQAAVLTTGALNSEGTQHFHCTLANLNTNASSSIMAFYQVIQNVEFIDGVTGTVSSSTGETTLGPGMSTNMIGTDTDNGYCRFTFKGSPKKVRAGMNVHNAVGDQVVAYLPAT